MVIRFLESFSANFSNFLGKQMEELIFPMKISTIWDQTQCPLFLGFVFKQVLYRQVRLYYEYNLC